MSPVETSRVSSPRAAPMAAEDRRAMIVSATLPLLLREGDKVTSRTIAEAAGIAEGTIFRVFADKDELIGAAIDQALDPEPLERALREIDPAAPVRTQLEQAVTVLQQRVVDVWRLLSSVGPRFHDRARRPMADSDALVALCRRNKTHLRVPPVRAARLLRGLTLSATHPMLAGEPMPASEIVDVLLHGIGADSC